MKKLILTIAKVVISLMEKRGLAESERLHKAVVHNHEIAHKIEEAKTKTAELEDRLALAELVLNGVEANSTGKIQKASDVLGDKVKTIKNIIGGWNR